jgi:MtrB/PioB family decaheme-associated outer membrane protein
MTSSRPWLLLGTLGVLSAAAADDAVAVDMSQWKCESCPFEQGVSGTLDAGPAYVSQASNRFGDFSGLDRKGAYLLGSGSVRYRGADGLFANATAVDLGRDAASVAADVGREGAYSLQMAYDELPRHLSQQASTPFLGVGGNTLALPSGYPAATTAAMPLASTLQPVDIGYKRSWLDLGATWLATNEWSVRVGGRHLVRQGTEPTSGAFFATTAQLVAPVDQTTDQVEVSGSYSSRHLQATLSYQASLFRNAQDSLTWTNPFTNGTIGATQGQLALPPDNQFHQVQAAIGYQPSPQVQTSAQLAIGRMTQDASFLASTLNDALTVPGLPATSLHGRVDTLDATVRLTASPTERLRLNASYARDQRDNKTPSATYPSVSTDMFVGPSNTNQPYSFTEDRLKLGADYRGPASLKVGVGADYDAHQRTLQEVGMTREVTVYTRLAAQPMENLSLSLKLAHGDRTPTEYRAVASIDPAENPLLRKYNLARRLRDSAAARADFTVSEGVAVGFDVDWAHDDYPDTAIGLTSADSLGIGGDASVALGEKTRLQLFVHTDTTRSNQSGSQQYGQADWTGRNKDGADVLGLGLRHTASDKLELGADLSYSRSRNSVSVDTGVSSPPFPNATTTLEGLKLFADYRLRANLTLTGSYRFEHYDASDWHLDGVLPGTVPNLLTLGELAPHYNVQVVRVALRYRF